MCGISVIINKSNQTVSKDQIIKMTDVIAHRGPDGFGYYFGNNFALGHRRLAIIDLTSDGHQPMLLNELVITYNGEIFNYIELRDELKTFGYHFSTQTDTEVVLVAYKHWGFECQNKFNGMWSFVIFDPSKNLLFCSKDRFNQKPFHYTTCGENFLIGSEIKQFISQPEFRPILNKRAAFDFLEHSLLNHTTNTFFENVYSLLPGHQLIYDLDNHNFIISKWYLPNLKINHSIAFKEACIEYRKLFIDSVRLRMRADVKVGSALSGGIDSSAMVGAAYLAINNKEIFSSITSCYKEKKYDESYYAELVTKKSGLELIKVYPKMEEFFIGDIHSKIILHQEQPLLSGSHFSEYSVFESAAQNKITVMMCGQGPDEHSAGYLPFVNIYFLSLLHQLKWNLLCSELRSSELKKFVNFLFLNKISYFIHKKPDIINYAKFNYPKSKIRFGIFAKFKSIHQYSIYQVFKSSIPYQAHSEDRNSMLFSIESRGPYLDHRLVEYAIQLPDNYKIKKTKTKYILREAVKDLMPFEVYSRTDKMGFVAPDDAWLKENSHHIRCQLEEALINLKDLILPELLTQYDSYVAGKSHYNPIYFKIISLNVFVKQFQLKMQE